jgi:hypothetical protein
MIFRKYPISILLLFFLSLSVSAQKYKLSGKVYDEQSKVPLVGVTIVLSNVTDTIIQYYAVTNDKGSFSLKGIKAKPYMIRTYYVGYESYKQEITIAKTDEKVDSIKLTVKKSEIQEVVVKNVASAVVLKGDTSEMSAAAFKVTKDASAEDLVKKMPTITIDNTGVKAQGESVKQVLVDGKRFFGDDASVALKNLPADVIDKIQIFDKISDQAQLTGFDDGNTTKTMNIVTKSNSRNGVFGKFYGGYGTDQRYLTGGNLNIFNGDRRISLVGIGNNVNQNLQEFSGYGGRGGGGGIL